MPVKTVSIIWKIWGSFGETVKPGMIGGMKTIYETAKNGGDYSKFYDQYKKKYTKELDKSIRSFNKVIEEHKM